MQHHKGDTIHIILDYTLNGIPIAEANVDEIELMIGEKRCTLTGGDIELIDSKYEIFLNQEDTFALNSIIPYQIRVLKDGEVGSLPMKQLFVYESMSKKVLGDDNGE